MGEAALVSVIILTYRYLDGIYETLDSILVQTYPNIELIISDDGSPNFSDYEEKIKSYIQDRCRSNIKNVLLNKLPYNQGTVRNINSAIKKSSGKYIKLIAAEDCFIERDAIGRYVNYMQKTDHLICFAKVCDVSADGIRMSGTTLFEGNYKRLASMTPKELRNYLFEKNRLPAPAAFMDRRLFERYGYFPESIRLIEDYPYWLYLCGKGVRFGFFNRVLVSYKLTGATSKGNYSLAFMEDLCKVYEQFVFPYDKRFGMFQLFYNKLRIAGLNTYIALAKWKEYSRFQKCAIGIKYAPFMAYIWWQRKIRERASERV